MVEENIVPLGKKRIDYLYEFLIFEEFLFKY